MSRLWRNASVTDINYALRDAVWQVLHTQPRARRRRRDRRRRRIRPHSTGVYKGSSARLVESVCSEEAEKHTSRFQLVLGPLLPAGTLVARSDSWATEQSPLHRGYTRVRNPARPRVHSGRALGGRRYFWTSY